MGICCRWDNLSVKKEFINQLMRRSSEDELYCLLDLDLKRYLWRNLDNPAQHSACTHPSGKGKYVSTLSPSCRCLCCNNDPGGFSTASSRCSHIWNELLCHRPLAFITSNFTPRRIYSGVAPILIPWPCKGSRPAAPAAKATCSINLGQRPKYFLLQVAIS